MDIPFLPPDRKPKRKQPERGLQIALVQYLTFQSAPGVLWFHVPNGGVMTAHWRAMQKKLGVLAGAADFIFLIDGRVCFLELKRPGGYQSEDQKAFEIRALRAGGRYEVARSIDEAIGICRAWGVLKPALRTESRDAA